MSRDYRVHYAMEDYVAAAELVRAARLHCRLVLEHSRATTTIDRRKAIIKQIENLRASREAILERFVEQECL